jgi:hypothetical protein
MLRSLKITCVAPAGVIKVSKKRRDKKGNRRDILSPD